MTTALAQISGRVTHVSIRSGVAKATGNAYEMIEAIVLVAGRQTVSVSIPKGVLPPAVGDDVNYLVEVSTFRDAPQFRMSEILEPAY